MSSNEYHFCFRRKTLGEDFWAWGWRIFSIGNMDWIYLFSVDRCHMALFGSYYLDNY